MSEIHNFTLSEVLKQTRLAKKLSLDEVELQTKIRSSYIEALENADYSKLPADIYVRGILKNYSDFLDLKYNDILRLYRKEGHIQGISPENEKKYLDFRSLLSDLVITNKFISGTIFILVTLTIVFLLWKQIEKLNAPPYLEIITPAEQIYEDPNIIISGKTEKNSIVRINGQKISSDALGIFSEDFVLKPGENIIRIQSISNRSNKQTTIEKNIFYKDNEKELNKISLETLVPTYIKVLIEDNVVLDEEVSPGHIHTFSTDKDLIIQSDSGHQTLIQLNEEDKKSLSEDDIYTEYKIESNKNSTIINNQ